MYALSGFTELSPLQKLQFLSGTPVILTLTTGFIALRILIYLAFQSFDFERT
jgi:hypothetical protein